MLHYTILYTATTAVVQYEFCRCALHLITLYYTTGSPWRRGRIVHQGTCVAGARARARAQALVTAGLRPTQGCRRRQIACGKGGYKFPGGRGGGFAASGRDPERVLLTLLIAATLSFQAGVINTESSCLGCVRARATGCTSARYVVGPGCITEEVPCRCFEPGVSDGGAGVSVAPAVPRERESVRWPCMLEATERSGHPIRRSCNQRPLRMIHRFGLLVVTRDDVTRERPQ